MKPVRFKMVGNNNPFAIAEVVEDGDIRSFRMNPEWEEVVEAPEPLLQVEKTVKKRSQTKEI